VTRGGRPARCLLGLSLAMTLAACRKPPAALLRDVAESAHSWIQGADMAADLWTRGLVPAGFTRIAVQDAQKGIEAERARLGREGVRWAAQHHWPCVAEAVCREYAALVATAALHLDTGRCH